MGGGSGRIVSDIDGIDCGRTCGAEYFATETVTLAALPDRGTLFAGWSGACTGLAAECSVAMASSQAVEATFVKEPDRIGVFRPGDGYWYLDANGNGKWDGCKKDQCLGRFGIAGDQPVVGNWTGERLSTIGLFRPAYGIWALDLNGDGAWSGYTADHAFGPYGLRGDAAVAADWYGLGVDSIGVFRAGMWYVDRNGNGRSEGCPPDWSVDRNSFDWCIGPFGKAGDQPVTGDWNGTGKEGIGIFRASSGLWALTDAVPFNRYVCGNSMTCLGPFGIAGDLAVAGDWTGSGKSRIGVFRPSTGYWYLDINGNGTWDGCAVDSCLGPFGLKGDLPVVGQW